MKRSTRYSIYYLLLIASIDARTRASIWRAAAARNWSEDRAWDCLDWLDERVLDPRYTPNVPTNVFNYSLQKRLDNEKE